MSVCVKINWILVRKDCSLCYVLLAVHLVTVFVNNQPDAQFIILIFVYSNSLHVSCNQVLIIRTVNCINTTAGICRQPCGMQVPSKPAYHTVTYVQ